MNEEALGGAIILSMFVSIGLFVSFGIVVLLEELK